MLVGVLTGDSLYTYTAMTGASPIHMIVPPVLYLSHPEDRISPRAKQVIEQGDIKVVMRAVMFRHLFNSNTGISGYYAAALPENSSISPKMLQASYGVVPADPQSVFVPFFLLALEGMRSYSTRAFCRSFATSLASQPLEFTLTLGDKSDLNHSTLFENYNEEAAREFEGAAAIGSTILP